MKQNSLKIDLQQLLLFKREKNKYSSISYIDNIAQNNNIFFDNIDQSSLPYIKDRRRKSNKYLSNNLSNSRINIRKFKEFDIYLCKTISKNNENVYKNKICIEKNLIINQYRKINNYTTSVISKRKSKIMISLYNNENMIKNSCLRNINNYKSYNNLNIRFGIKNIQACKVKDSFKEMSFDSNRNSLINLQNSFTQHIDNKDDSNSSLYYNCNQLYLSNAEKCLITNPVKKVDSKDAFVLNDSKVLKEYNHLMSIYKEKMLNNKEYPIIFTDIISDILNSISRLHLSNNKIYYNDLDLSKDNSENSVNNLSININTVSSLKSCSSESQYSCLTSDTNDNFRYNTNFKLDKDKGFFNFLHDNNDKIHYTYELISKLKYNIYLCNEYIDSDYDKYLYYSIELIYYIKNILFFKEYTDKFDLIIKNYINIPNINKHFSSLSKSYNLIIDLDETLIHSEHININNRSKYDLIIEDLNIGVFIRPYVYEFLNYCYDNFNLFIYSAGEKMYVNSVLSALNIKDYFVYIFDNNYCIMLDCIAIKDLSLFKDIIDLDNTLFLDNNMFSFSTHLDNGILISNYYGNFKNILKNDNTNNISEDIVINSNNSSLEPEVIDEYVEDKELILTMYYLDSIIDNNKNKDKTTNNLNLVSMNKENFMFYSIYDEIKKKIQTNNL